MKLFNKELVFNKWSIYSRWIDVSVFYEGYDCKSYLLQAKVNRFTNKKKFRCTAIQSGMGGRSPNYVQVAPLTQLLKEQITGGE